MLRVGAEGDRSCGLLLKDAGASGARSHAERGNDKDACLLTKQSLVSKACSDELIQRQVHTSVKLVV